MKSLEEFGRTVEEARNKAFKALGIRSSDEPGVEVEVLDPGSPGNDVGWGRKFARVKVTLRRAAAPAPIADDGADDTDDAESPQDLLEEILDLMHLQASVEEGEYDGQAVLNIVGPDLGILIGKHGQTLEALQFVLNMIVNHNKEERTRIVVDVGGYRERRERTLRELAHRMARRAYDEQCNVALEPMLANERRIIHITLAEDKHVETYSQGEEPMRKVIIAPRKQLRYPGFEDTIAAIATPPGEGGVGIIRLSGTAARAILRAVFRTPAGRERSRWDSHRLYLGTVRDKHGETLDEVMAVVMMAPRSYTGEDVVELHGHGGPAPLRRLLDRVIEAGGRHAQPGEFTLRAFCNGRLDLAQAEAVLDVIRSRTDLSLRMALGQYAGKLSRRVGELTAEVLDWIAQLEASIDFPEDDIPSLSQNVMLERADHLAGRIAQMLGSAEAGRLLRDGLRVAIVGKPNVGKSSLLNALLGESRAIVTPIAGTTRDTIEEWVNLRGIPMRVIDTAGIRHSEDVLETMGIERSRQHLQECDVALLMFDCSRPWSDEDDHIVELALARPSLFVINKTDVAASAAIAAALPGPAVPISAVNGTGLEQLADALVSKASGGVPMDHELVSGNVRHREALYRAAEHLAQARATIVRGLPADFITIDLRAGVQALGEITGTAINDEIVSRIFSQFCIGK